MFRHFRAAVMLVALLAIFHAAGVQAQMTHRLKGSIRAEAGAPITGATIRADVLSGFRGEPFAGQKEHSVTSTDKGEWNLLKIAAELLAAGKKDEAAQALTVALGPDVPVATRVAAGEMALLVQQPSLAKTIFGLVLQADPKHPRALVGAASASLLGRDWESAGKQLWAARDLAPKDQRQALAAAINDLQGISRVQ